MAVRDGSVVYSREVPAGDSAGWKDLIVREADEASLQIRLGPEGVLEKIVLAGEASETAYQEIREDFPDCELVQSCIGVEIPARTNILSSRRLPASAWPTPEWSGARRSSWNLLPPERKNPPEPLGLPWPAAILGLIILALLGALGFTAGAEPGPDRQARPELSALKNTGRKSRRRTGANRRS